MFRSFSTISSMEGEEDLLFDAKLGHYLHYRMGSLRVYANFFIA